MIEIRIHGRGGQGVVTAAELIVIAAFHEGLEVQAFPNFGVERSGAPIVSYARISQQPILSKEQIYRPNILIIQDHSLLNNTAIWQGVTQDTLIILNYPAKLSLPIKFAKYNIITTPASSIAQTIFQKNIVNTIILGAFVKHNKLIQLANLEKAIKIKFKSKGKKIIDLNIKAVRQVYND